MRSCPRGRRRSVDRGRYRLGIEPRNRSPAAQAAGTPGCRRSWNRRKATPSTPLSQGVLGPRAVADPTHVRKSTLYGNREIPRLSAEERTADRVWETERRTSMMNGRGKSDSSKVPGKLPNKAEEPVAEAMEGTGLAKGNSPEGNVSRTQGPSGKTRSARSSGCVRQQDKDRKHQSTA